MSNCLQFTEKFFDSIELYEDKVNGHYYKAYIREAVKSFLENENQETAFAVYRAFFDIYRISMGEGDNPFVDIVDILRNYEATAATLIDKQRDHFIHSVNVFISGLSIWASNAAYRDAFASAVPEPSFTAAYPDAAEEFFFRWGLASLFHDIGYPVEIIGNQINGFIKMVADADGDDVKVKASISYENFDELNHIKEIIPKNEFTGAYQKAFASDFAGADSCASIGADAGAAPAPDLLAPLDILAHRIHTAFGTDLDTTRKAVNGFAAQMADSGFIDHGYYSALIILKWYGCAIQMTGVNPERFYWSVADSAAAIFLHNYYKNAMLKAPFNLGAMNAKDSPIAFLLILCDELQEWNREARGKVTKTFTLADTVNLSITDSYLAATYVTRKGRLPKDYCSEKKELLHRLLDLDAIFAQGFDVDAESLDSFAEIKEKLAEGAGENNARIQIEKLELLAIAIHALYNEKQLADNPEKALEYPDFSKLPDDLKYSNLRQALDILSHLDAVNLRMAPKGKAGALKEIPADLVEYMAELEHEAWMRERIASGWTAGPRSAENKTTPYLVPYSELTEEIKDFDRDAIRNIPKLAERIGMAVYESD